MGDTANVACPVLFKPPILSRDEERALGERISRGDVDARKTLVEHNTRLVASVAWTYRNRGLDIEDLVSEGLIGLLRAAEKFDPLRGVRFSTYAMWWIKQGIRRGLAERAPLIHVPSHAQQEVRDGRNGTFAAQVQTALAWATPFGVGPRGTRVEDSLESDAARPEQNAMASERLDDLQERLSHLDPRAEYVLRRRWGVGFPEATLREIGEELKVSRERVRQIEASALDELHRPVPAHVFTVVGIDPGKKHTGVAILGSEVSLRVLDGSDLLSLGETLAGLCAPAQAVAIEEAGFWGGGLGQKTAGGAKVNYGIAMFLDGYLRGRGVRNVRRVSPAAYKGTTPKEIIHRRLLARYGLVSVLGKSGKTLLSSAGGVKDAMDALCLAEWIRREVERHPGVFGVSSASPTPGSS